MDHGNIPKRRSIPGLITGQNIFMTFFLMRLSLIFWLVGGPGIATAETNSNPSGLVNLPGKQALAILQDAFAHESGWDKLRAAENLIDLGYPQEASKILRAEIPSKGNEAGYRIGLWCALAKSADSEADRSKWVDQIREASLNPRASDRVEAIKSLGKLGYKTSSKETEEFERVAQTGSDAFGFAAKNTGQHPPTFILQSRKAYL